MKYYIEYLCENESAYRRSLFFSVLSFSITLVILISVITDPPQNRIEGEVQLIEKTQVLRKNNNTFEIGQGHHSEDIIAIRINGLYYSVETNFQSRWNEVIDQVHVGDQISITYVATNEGNRIRKLQKGITVILHPDELKKAMFKFKIVTIVVATALFSYILILFFKRRSYIKKINTSYKPHDGGL